MQNISVDFSQTVGKIKPMHAVNNGPLKKRKTQTNHNFDSYKALGIPFARNHDAAFCTAYGGPNSNDILGIFPNFDADPEDPASYDFVLTDEYMERILSAGTEPYFRLGHRIEHEIKKYGTLPPKDFKKWAVICEHVILHMNYGWANGHHYGIRYWEIWNEPDLDPDDAEDKRTWGGTKEQFFDLYRITSTHLKTKFPELMIGGPALANKYDWASDFIHYCKTESLPLDFFSWHVYAHDVDKVNDKAVKFHDLLIANGFDKTESILNEWNYIEDWSDQFVYSVKQIIDYKGGAFDASVMLRCQNAPVDMLMYYDARPSVFNGLWGYYDSQPLKPYYAFAYFSELYKLGKEVKVSTEGKVEAVAATNGENAALMLSSFTDDDNDTVMNELSIDLSGFDYSKITMRLTGPDDFDTVRALEKEELKNIRLPKNGYCLLKFEK